MVSRRQQDQEKRAWIRANPDAARREAKTNRQVGLGFRANEVTWLAHCEVGACDFTAESKGDEDGAKTALKEHHDLAHPGMPWAPPGELSWEAGDEDQEGA